MADLTRFFRNQKARLSVEYDQKSMMARDMIAQYFGESEDSEKLREVINHFANSERAAISIMGVLSQVGLAAIAMDDCTIDTVDEAKGGE